MLSPKQPSQDPIIPSLSSLISPAEALDAKVKDLLKGDFADESIVEDVEKYLKKGAYEALIVKTNEVKEMLEQHGFEATIRYCSSFALGHSVPVVTARSAKGEYGVPSFNLWWTPLERRGARGSEQSSGAKQLLTGQGCADWDSSDRDVDIETTVLQVEKFSRNAPVHLLLVPSDTADCPVAIRPIFSGNALTEARRHAAEIISSGNKTDYSFVFHEVLAPEVGKLICGYSSTFGEQETANFRDNGTDPQGGIFLFRALYEDNQEQVSMSATVLESKEDKLRLKVKLENC